MLYIYRLIRTYVCYLPLWLVPIKTRLVASRADHDTDWLTDRRLCVFVVLHYFDCVCSLMYLRPLCTHTYTLYIHTDTLYTLVKQFKQPTELNCVHCSPCRRHSFQAFPSHLCTDCPALMYLGSWFLWFSSVTLTHSYYFAQLCTGKLLAAEGNPSSWYRLSLDVSMCV